MKYLLLIPILFLACNPCPKCPDTVETGCDTAKFEIWATQKDSILRAMALKYADSLFSERKDSLRILHYLSLKEINEYRSKSIAEINRKWAILDSARNIRNNTLIQGDSARKVKSVGFNADGKQEIIFE